MTGKVFLYGAYQDGTMPSNVATDVNFGDVTIQRTLTKVLTGAGFVVEPVLPDDNDKLLAITKDDYLVIGGGGLLHPNCLNRPALEPCQAKKAVFGVGINWENGTNRQTVKDLQEVAGFFADIPFVVVRDWQTKAVLRLEHAKVCPDPVLSNWIGPGEPGTEKALAIDHGLEAEPDEKTICLRKLYWDQKAELITDIGQLTKFGRIRTSAYHGMLLSLVVNATADVYVHNAKHEAFLMSYWDKLDVTYGANFVSVSSTKQEWFKAEADKHLAMLVDYLKG